MTIREIQQRTGLDRATVYYYEREGLIAPARRANGYRDYSDTDLTALRRIRLLRQLGVSLEQVRAVQTGAEPLSAALAGRLAALEAQQAENARALAVCRAIQKAGVDFDGLDPDAFALSAGPAVRDAPRPARCAGRRALARMLDTALCTLPVTALLALVLHRDPLREWPLYLAGWLAGALLLTWLLEPLLLRRWGATPGKALVGLRVEDAGGGALRAEQAVGRTVRLLGRLARLWLWPRALRQYRETGLFAWDEDSGTLPTARPAGPARRAAAALALAAWLAVTGALGVLAGFVPHTGPLTARQLVENYNFLARFEGEPEARLTLTGDPDGHPGIPYQYTANLAGFSSWDGYFSGDAAARDREMAAVALWTDREGRVVQADLLWVWPDAEQAGRWPAAELSRLARAFAAGQGVSRWSLPRLDALLQKQPACAGFRLAWEGLTLDAALCGPDGDSGGRLEFRAFAAK